MDFTPEQQAYHNQRLEGFQGFMQNALFNFLESADDPLDVQPGMTILSQLGRLLGDTVWRITDASDLPQAHIETKDQMVQHLLSFAFKEACGVVDSLNGAGPFEIVPAHPTPDLPQ